MRMWKYENVEMWKCFAAGVRDLDDSTRLPECNEPKKFSYFHISTFSHLHSHIRKFAHTRSFLTLIGSWISKFVYQSKKNTICPPKPILPFILPSSRFEVRVYYIIFFHQLASAFEYIGIEFDPAFGNK